MVDKIKSSSPPVLRTLEKEQIAPSNAKSNESLRQGFQTLSNTLSVTERAVKDTKVQKSESKASEATKKPPSESKLSSLNDAVRFSKEALNALEQVTAGGLSSKSVSALLSDDEENESSGIQLKDKSDKPAVVEIANDLDALKTNLRDLFTALKQKADKSNITIANQEASNPSVEDLDKAKELAKNASNKIEFNPQKAMDAHSGIDLQSVTRLLREDSRSNESRTA